MVDGSGFQVRVRYFAAARELVGAAEERVVIVETPSTAAAVLKVLGDRHPRLRPHLARMRVAVNSELVDGEAPVHAGDELDVLPPVAGGADDPVRLCEVREAPLSVDECMDAVAHDAAGAIAVFTGVVRNHAEGKPVARLDYEAHPELAGPEMRRILGATARDKPDVRLAAVHRVGELAVGDLAVVVAASAPHRADAFDACRDAIERIKAAVPIWKKEWAPDGAAHWVNLD